jgi:hypothetical protein
LFLSLSDLVLLGLKLLDQDVEIIAGKILAGKIKIHDTLISSSECGIGIVNVVHCIVMTT